MADWKGRGGGRPGQQPTIEDSTAATGDPGANSPNWQGRGGGRHRPQPDLEDATAHVGDEGADGFSAEGLVPADCASLVEVARWIGAECDHARPD